MLDHYYVYINDNICYYCNNPWHDELPGIGEGWDPYTSFLQVYPTVEGITTYGSGKTVKFLLNMDGEFVMPDWSSGLCAGAINIINLDKCNCSGVRGTTGMFQGYRGTTLDLSMLSFDSLEEARDMFHQCPNLVWIDLPKITWQRDEMLYYSSDMFSRCPNLERIYITDPSYWDTTNSDSVHASTNMFMYSSKLPYYEAEDYPIEGGSTFDAEYAGAYIEIRRWKIDEWTGDLLDERVHRGGYFTQKEQRIEGTFYEHDGTDWREMKTYVMSNSEWAEYIPHEFLDPEWGLPDYDPDYDWDYYGVLPDGRTIDVWG